MIKAKFIEFMLACGTTDQSIWIFFIKLSHTHYVYINIIDISHHFEQRQRQFEYELQHATNLRYHAISKVVLEYKNI